MCRPPFKNSQWNTSHPTFFHWISCFTHKYVRSQRTFYSVFMNHYPFVLIRDIPQINQWKSMCGISRVCVCVWLYSANCAEKVCAKRPLIFKWLTVISLTAIWPQTEIHYVFIRQPCHPAAQDWLPTEAKQGWAGQYLDGRPPVKTKLLLEEVLKRPFQFFYLIFYLIISVLLSESCSFGR